mgnify:FL=1
MIGFCWFRSLPNLAIVKQLSLAGIYNLDPKLSDFPMFVRGNEGLIAFVSLDLTLYSCY